MPGMPRADRAPARAALVGKDSQRPRRGPGAPRGPEGRSGAGRGALPETAARDRACRRGGTLEEGLTERPARFVGTAGWTIPRAHRDRFAPVGSQLQRYASQLNAVEINSSFYRSDAAA